MQPVNQAERSKAFLNFLLFFIITIVFILGAVFFSVQVPFKQNAKLQEQVAAFDNEKTLAERFANKLNETIGYFESVNKQDSQPERVNNQITQNLNELGSMINADSTLFKGLYQNIINSLYDLQAAKKDLRGASSLDASVGELEKKLNQCMAENARLQNLVLMQQQR
jgi:predicted PurR-regulated permease PerM